MFRVEVDPTKRAGTFDKVVIDRNRSTSLEYVTKELSDVGLVLKLVSNRSVVPLEIVTQKFRDEDNGEVFFLIRFRRFGNTIAAKPFYGIDAYLFRDAAEQHELQLLAVEALLAFGGFFDGDKHPDGEIRVEYKGHFYRKSDFQMN